MNFDAYLEARTREHMGTGNELDWDQIMDEPCKELETELTEWANEIKSGSEVKAALIMKLVKKVNEAADEIASEGEI